tara:strand:+ start:2556 stop:3809 length:1254 start_codon:yes stop_codon:yes gene_type:complete
MSQFNGNNNQGTLEQFISRRDFSVNAYGRPTSRDMIYPIPVKDFNFAERALYGRIGKMHNPIFLNSPRINLRQLTSDDTSGPLVQAVNFVADAFDKFVADWQNANAQGKISQEAEYLVDISPQRGYENYVLKYNNYRVSLKDSFLKTYLTPDRKERIVDLRTFMPIFMDFLIEVARTVPVTSTSYITSKFAGPLISGLAIELATFDASDDSIKERFINSENFEFYKRIAKLNGFSIDKQVPWRLVADIASPEMLKFSINYGQTTENDILRNYYSRAGGTDIKDIRQLALDTYNTLVTQSPVIRQSSSLSDVQRCGQRYIRRSVATINEFVDAFSSQFWIDMYIQIRYNEQQGTISEGALHEIKKVCDKLLGTLASENICITFINDNIKTFDNFKGSYAQRVVARENRLFGSNVQPSY